MATPSQDYAASITWTQTWAAHLVANGSAFTISSATATCSTPGVTVASTTVTGSGTSVTFKVSQTGLTVPTTVNVVVTPTMSNGDIDQRNFPILFTDT
jgi:hypothetical protein